MRSAWPALVAVLTLVTSSGAVTYDEVIRLHRHGASVGFLVALIETDGSRIELDGVRLIELREAGVGEPVIEAMVATRQPKAAPQAQPAPEPSRVRRQLPQRHTIRRPRRPASGSTWSPGSSSLSVVISTGDGLSMQVTPLITPVVVVGVPQPAYPTVWVPVQTTPVSYHLSAFPPLFVNGSAGTYPMPPQVTYVQRPVHGLDLHRRDRPHRPGFTGNCPER